MITPTATTKGYDDTITLAQAHALGITDADISKGEKRFESKCVGAWHVAVSHRAIVEHSDFNGLNKIQRYWPMRTMYNLSQGAGCTDGWVSLGGKKYSCFTTNVILKIEETGALINCAAIFVRLPDGV